MSQLIFDVLGEPIGQARPRFARIGGHVRTYDTAKSKDNKAYIRLSAQQAMQEQGFVCSEKPLAVEIFAYMSIPASKSKKFKERAIDGKEKPTKKPDADNIIKAVLDALNGVCYKDDKQIIDVRCVKAYAVSPLLRVRIKEV